MARGKAISVKIQTTKVIKALETALDKLNNDYTSQEANKAKHEKALEKWSKEVAKLAMSKISKAENMRANVRYNGLINIDFDLPAGSMELPEQPKSNFVSIHEWQYKEQKDELENAIRILKMTDEEVVNTSTYNAVARYL